MDPRRRADFVDALVADLAPVRPAPPTGRALVLWIAAALPLTAAGVALGGPLRDGALADLGTTRLALELALGSATMLSLAAAGLETAVPGGRGRAASLLLALLVGGAWLGVSLHGGGLDGPAASMAGKRAHCFLEGVAIAALPALLLLRAVRLRSFGRGGLAGLLVGMAAGALPALAMQIACMYDPAHALAFHLSPVLVLGLAGALWAALRVEGG